MIFEEQGACNSLANQEEPRPKYPSPKAQIHSPYQPTKDRPALLSNLICLWEMQRTQVNRMTKSTIIHTAHFQTRQQQGKSSNPHAPISLPESLHNQPNHPTIETPIHYTPQQKVSPFHYTP